MAESNGQCLECQSWRMRSKHSPYACEDYRFWHQQNNKIERREVAEG